MHPDWVYGMHSQEQLGLLLENSIVQELLEILENEGKVILQSLDLEYVDHLFEERKSTKRGRPRTYNPSDDLKAILYGLAEGKSALRAIARTVQTTTAQVFLGLENGGMSYSTLERFWHQLAELAEEVFKGLASTIVDLGMLGNTQAVDSTDIKTPFLDDPDAVWSYDSTRKEYYYGYGLLLVVDVESQIPIAANFIQRKQASKDECFDVVNDALSVKTPSILLGDSGFDIVELQEQLLNEKVLPVFTYNPRNTDEPLDIKYRIEHLVQQRTERVKFDRKSLDNDFKMRSAVENANNVLKQLGLEHIRVKGRNAVKAHVYLILILRLAIAIARFHKEPDCNLRKITLGG